MIHPLWRTMVNFPLILLNAELKVQVCVWAKVALFWCSEKTLQNIVMQLHWWQMNELEEIPAGSYGLGCFQFRGKCGQVGITKQWPQWSQDPV